MKHLITYFWIILLVHITADYIVDKPTQDTRFWEVVAGVVIIGMSEALIFINKENK